jgi:hypothetical protein
MPPVHSGATKYWCARSACVRYITTEEPFGAKPNLCVSMEMEVTPGTVKSKAQGCAKPASPAKGISSEPRHASTCSGSPRSSASAASSGMGSTTPCG